MIIAYVLLVACINRGARYRIGGWLSTPPTARELRFDLLATCQALPGPIGHLRGLPTSLPARFNNGEGWLDLTVVGNPDLRLNSEDSGEDAKEFFISYLGLDAARLQQALHELCFGRVRSHKDSFHRGPYGFTLTLIRKVFSGFFPFSHILL
jgi:hypothetical protein